MENELLPLGYCFRLGNLEIVIEAAYWKNDKQKYVVQVMRADGKIVDYQTKTGNLWMKLTYGI